MHYKDKNNNLYFEPTEEVVIRDGLVEITKKEFEQIVYEINNPTPTPEQLKQQRINELRQNLDQTEYKFNSDYDRKDTQEWLELKAQRQAWRDEIRELEA